MRENIVSGEVSPALWIEWSLYKCPLTFFFFLDFSLWNTSFVFQMSNIINKQRRYGFFSLFFLLFFRVSQYLSKPRDREFLCLILWGSVHVYVREMRRRDRKGEEEGWVFSWKYRNGRSRVLPWVMSLTKELEHLASHRLSVRTRQRNGSGRRRAQIYEPVVLNKLREAHWRSFSKNSTIIHTKYWI